MHCPDKILQINAQVGNRSSEFYPDVRKVRRDGCYIYEEFMPTGGTDVKVANLANSLVITSYHLLFTIVSLTVVLERKCFLNHSSFFFQKKGLLSMVLNIRYRFIQLGLYMHMLKHGSLQLWMGLS